MSVQNAVSPSVRSKPGFAVPTIPAPVISAIIAVALVSLAELAARQGWISELVLPAPSSIWAALWDGFSSGAYWPHIASTSVATVAGFAIAAGSALVVAGILASMPRLERVLVPFIFAFQCMPKIAVAPIIILILGFGMDSKITIVVAVCFFPIFVNTLQGLRLRDRAKYELLSSYGASRLQLFRYLRLPDAVPYVFAGLHIGVILAFIGSVVAEFVGSRSGLGYFMIQQRAVFNVPGTFAILFLLMSVGITLHTAMRYLERKIAFWTKDMTEMHI